MKVSELRQLVKEAIKELAEEEERTKDITPYIDFIALRDTNKNKTYLIKFDNFSKSEESMEVSYEWNSLDPYNSNPTSSTSFITIPPNEKVKIKNHQKSKHSEKPLSKYWDKGGRDTVVIGKKEKEEKEKSDDKLKKDKEENPTSGKIAKGLGKWGKAIANTVANTNLGPRYKPKA